MRHLTLAEKQTHHLELFTTTTL